MNARDPDTWTARKPGQGSCFHQAIDRWALLAETDPATDWAIAIGIVRMNPFCLERHLHAWLEAGDEVISAVTGGLEGKREFYERVGIEPWTVRLVPDRIVRRILRRGTLDRAAIGELLNGWGDAWAIRDSGVIPAGMTR